MPATPEMSMYPPHESEPVETPKVLIGKEVKKGGRADYFSLNVEVVAKLEEQSLIRYNDREFIVDTKDLA